MEDVAVCIFFHSTLRHLLFLLNMLLKPLFGRPGPPGLKCTSAAAPTLQQTVACGLWGFKSYLKLLTSSGFYQSSTIPSIPFLRQSSTTPSVSFHVSLPPPPLFLSMTIFHHPLLFFSMTIFHHALNFFPCQSSTTLFLSMSIFHHPISSHVNLPPSPLFLSYVNLPPPLYFFPC